MLNHRVEIFISSRSTPHANIQTLKNNLLIIIEMAEYRQMKSKSSRSLKVEEPRKSKSRRNRPHKEEANQYYLESKTPPLPTCSSSIEDLLKKRDSLKKELKKISDHGTSIKNDKYEAKYYQEKDTSIKLYSKRKSSYDNDSFLKKKKDRKTIITSPEYNNDYTLDSEDEENIIEQRRKQRKQLLEKFKNIHESELENKQDKNEISYEESQSNNESSNIISEINIVKEVPDMFSDKDEFIINHVYGHVTQDNDHNTQLLDNWDNSDGYYNTKIGDIIDNRYTIKSILGQGVFANVVRAQDNKNNNEEVAIKIIRNNEMMYKIGLKEISILKDLNSEDSKNKYHCIQFITYFKHKGHLCLVLEPMYMDLRGIIKKYGRRGLNMKALISYSRQLLLALRLLKKVGIVHADIKPDNILVNEKKNILKLCDFGSATRFEDNEPTPYLVSRFYRAPEIILGIPHKHGVDLWSAGCTIFEMASGKILFTGSSNNKMLKCFMDFKGKIPSRIIRKGKFKDQHFNNNNDFLMHKKDVASGREKVVKISNIVPTKDIHEELKKACKNLTSSEEQKLIQLKDFLDNILVYDANQRLSIVECLKHPFIQEELQKY